VVRIEIPPLRARKDDIPLLANSILKRLAAQHARSCRLSPAALESLTRFDWPGNVRELRNALENAMIFASGEEIQPGDLPAEVRTGVALPGKPSGRADGATALDEADFREGKRKFEIAFLTRKLEEHRWNVSRTAASVGLHRQSLQEKLRELGIQRPGKA
jgi:DNA-binding NtrC family response regulator